MPFETQSEKFMRPGPAFSPKPSFLLAVLLLLLGEVQCISQAPAGITGVIQMTEAWRPTLYLIHPRNLMEIASNYGGIVVDSAQIDAEGRFAFSHIPEQAQLYEIVIQKKAGRFPNQLLDANPAEANYMPVLLEKGATIEVSANAAQFQSSFAIKNPSPENQEMLRLRTLRRQTFSAQDPLLLNSEHATESNLLAREDALRAYQQPLMDFADSSPYLLPAILAMRWVSPVGDYERVPEFLFGLCEKWRPKAPDDPWVAQLCQLGSRAKLPVLTGDLFPDVLLPMASGDSVSLWQLLGKKLSVLDVWASWCMPCRRENREVLSPLWEKYKSAGLQIIGYSIDSNASAWKNALDKDAATWPQASHLSGDAAPLLDTIRITTIPANFLLDAHGKIIAKNLHGTALQSFVEDYLK